MPVITGSKNISEDYQNINTAFDNIQGQITTNKSTGDAHIANADIHVTATKKTEWDAKAPGSTLTDLNNHKTNAVVHVTQADHDKINGIEVGAQVNQNAFAKVNGITAANPSDTVTIKGGVGITISSNPTSKEVTVTATGSATPGAHGSAHNNDGADPIPDLVAVTTQLAGKQATIKLGNNSFGPDAQISSYPEGVSLFYVGAGTGGQGTAWKTATGATESFGYVETMRAGGGGYQIYTEMYSGTDATNITNNKQYKRVKRDSNAFWQPFEKIVDQGELDELLANKATIAQVNDKVSKSNGYISDANNADAGFHFLRSDSLNSADNDWATIAHIGGLITGRSLQLGQSWNVPGLPYTIRRGIGTGWSSWERILTQPYINTWLPLTLLNGWEAYDLSSYRVGVMRYVDGLVLVQATLKNGATSGAIATISGIAALPKKVIPATFYSRNATGSVVNSGQLELHPSGNIIFGIGGPPQTGALQFSLVYNERDDA